MTPLRTIEDDLADARRILTLEANADPFLAVRLLPYLLDELERQRAALAAYQTRVVDLERELTYERARKAPPRRARKVLSWI